MNRTAGMHALEKSDCAVLPVKQPNKGGQPSAEAVEGRAQTKENIVQSHMHPTLSGKRMSQGLDGVRKAARERKQERFTALLHHLSIELLRESFYALQRRASPGVDGVTWQEYETGLEDRLIDLHSRVHRGAYWAKPSRRVFIPKADGRQRPLGIAALKDKIVQQAVVTILNQIYEVDFRGFSYGSRPGRSPHQALDALTVGIQRKRVNWVLDADIRGYFDNMSHEWTMKFIEHRVADRRVLRLIQKWLKAGVSEDGQWSETKLGTPQGAVASPLLANVYLHYVFDLWADVWRKSGNGRHNRRPLCRRSSGGFSAPDGCRVLPERVPGTVGEVRLGTASGQDTSDRVRAVRRSQSETARTGEARDLHVPGSYSLLWAAHQ
jgi:retron-type reverse transcriptase